MKLKLTLTMALIAAATGVLIFGTHTRAQNPLNNDLDELNSELRLSKIRRGFEIAPVPLNLEHRNRALVGYGSYIVNAQSGCSDCHSCPTYAPGHNPYVGQDTKFNAPTYLAGGVPFGPFISKNITPDATGKPHGLTFDQFRDAIRTGVDPDDGGILQVMPWPFYHNMTDGDLRAVYEYLSAVPHAEPGTCSGAGQ
jgi:hypothetical protein